jgi:hypothetical protein
MRRAGAAPGVEDSEPDRRAGSNACCRRRYSSSVMMSSAPISLPNTEDGVDLEMGGVYGRADGRMEYGAVGRCRLEEVENCEVFEVLRPWRLLRGFTEVKLTSETDSE